MSDKFITEEELENFFRLGECHICGGPMARGEDQDERVFCPRCNWVPCLCEGDYR